MPVLLTRVTVSHMYMYVHHMLTNVFRLLADSEVIVVVLELLSDLSLTQVILIAANTSFNYTHINYLFPFANTCATCV